MIADAHDLNLCQQPFSLPDAVTAINIESSFIGAWADPTSEDILFGLAWAYSACGFKQASNDAHFLWMVARRK